MKRAISLFLALILVFLPASASLQATSFDPGMVLADGALLMSNAMTLQDVQAFLNEHRGVLKSYSTNDIDGSLKSAAQIVFDASQRNYINPQYLLVLLQKEQGLITDSTPYQSQLDWATGYAVCDSCDVNSSYVKAYKGFANQVEEAARRTRYFYDNIDEFVYRSGGFYNIDGQSVYIQNRATAALYNYTPHLQGNKIFFKLWDGWFGALEYPDGSLLQAYGEPGVWLIKNDKRHAFASKAALSTRHNINLVLQVPKDRIDQYEKGATITYPEFSLVRLPSGKISLIVDSQLRWIVDEFTFRQLGFTLDEVIQTTEDKLAYFSEGTPITPASLNPFGSLIQDPETYGVYYVKDGIKHPLIAPELLTLNFSKLRTRQASQGELERYTKGTPVELNDGLLVKTSNDPTVYAISGGMKRVIDSEFTFNSLGYDWTKIEIVSKKLLDLHELGDELSVQPLTDEEAEILSSR